VIVKVEKLVISTLLNVEAQPVIGAPPSIDKSNPYQLDPLVEQKPEVKLPAELTNFIFVIGFDPLQVISLALIVNTDGKSSVPAIVNV
jgi:hypothetical protein